MCAGVLKEIRKEFNLSNIFGTKIYYQSQIVKSLTHVLTVTRNTTNRNWSESSDSSWLPVKQYWNSNRVARSRQIWVGKHLSSQERAKNSAVWAIPVYFKSWIYMKQGPFYFWINRSSNFVEKSQNHGIIETVLPLDSCIFF